MFVIHSQVLLVALILITAVNSNKDEIDDSGTPLEVDPEDELHMDAVPTGYLLDSVYRELAWYGILQIQPLYYSTKHKVAARWIWQNTLGRPHVILQNSPTSNDNEEEDTYQSLMEDSAKWVREQRAAIDVLMENIRAGGNGLTVRTVVGAKNKTAYIIQGGKSFECEEGSEPDVDAFRQQSNIHERQCTEGKVPTPVPFDMCMDAEFAELEYSFVDGWSFCMGDGDRDVPYNDNGDLNCGQKTKVLFSHFLEQCAIDHNVVITYDYYGDEPRKDLIRNTTICTTWDPCRFSYLYRIELPTPEKPEVPTTTPDPCDTTVCEECIEGHTPEEYVDIDINLSDSPPSQLDQSTQYTFKATTLKEC